MSLNNTYEQTGNISETTPPLPVPTETLPERMTKYDVLRLIRRLKRPLGLNETDLSVLEVLADPTRPEDWRDVFRQPMNYQKQSDLAFRTGVDVRSFRRSEQKLEKVGLIRKDVPLNGFRSAFKAYASGQSGYGVSLQPLIDQVEKLMALLSRIEAEQEHISVLRVKGSILRRKVSRLIEDLTDCDPDDPLYSAYCAIRAEWPQRPGAITDIPTLSRQLSELESYHQKLMEIPLVSTQLQSNMSGAPVKFDRCHIQTVRNSNVKCSKGAEGQTDDYKSSDINSEVPTPHGEGSCLEKKYEKPKSSVNPNLLEQLTPNVLADMASKDFNFYINALKKTGKPLDMEDLQIAAVHMLRELRISACAYEEALNHMGYIDALITLIVIDRNRTHPTKPVKSPGGALRAFCRKHKTGNLNLQASIFGILHRGKTIQ